MPIRIKWNPLSHLVETKTYYKSARIIRSSFKQRIKDAFNAFFGDLFKSETETGAETDVDVEAIKLGLFDYFLILPRPFFNLTRSLYHNLKEDTLENKAATTTGAKMGGYARASDCIKNGMVVLGLILGLVASIRIIPKVILTMGIGVVALALNLIKAAISVAATLASAFLLALPIHLLTWPTRSSLFKHAKSLEFKPESYPVPTEVAKNQTLGNFIEETCKIIKTGDEEEIYKRYSLSVESTNGFILFQLKGDKNTVGAIELENKPLELQKEEFKALVRLNLFNVTTSLEASASYNVESGHRREAPAVKLV